MYIPDLDGIHKAIGVWETTTSQEVCESVAKKLLNNDTVSAIDPKTFSLFEVSGRLGILIPFCTSCSC